MLNELMDRQADILCNLAKQDGGQVTATMHGNGGCASIGMAETLVGASLPDLRKTEDFQNPDDFTRLQDGDGGWVTRHFPIPQLRN